MIEPRLAKRWKAVELQIMQAADFLHEPGRFSMDEMELKEYQCRRRDKELELAMDALAQIALVHGARPGFWRRLQKAAINLGLSEKVEEYDSRFHDALSGNP